MSNVGYTRPLNDECMTSRVIRIYVGVCGTATSTISLNVFIPAMVMIATTLDNTLGALLIGTKYLSHLFLCL